jgi:DNA-binding GntR family transcriptional regulator
MSPSSGDDRGPVVYRSKTDATYIELRNRILEGSLAPSESLNQEQLAAELGVSTTPLREALRRLETEGLVQMQPHRDVVVAPLNRADIVSLYEVRRVLDSFAARLAASRHDDEDRRAMEAASKALKSPSEDPVSDNRAFHAAIYRASRNPVLIDVLDSLWDRSDRYRRAISGIARSPQVVQSHLELMQAVLARSPARAEKLMSEHIKSAQESVEQAIASDAPRRRQSPPRQRAGKAA